MWRKLAAIAAAGALLDWATTFIGLGTGLCYETSQQYNPLFALILLTSLSLLSFRLGRLCGRRLRLAYTVLALAISACGYLAAINNVIVILQLPH